MYTAIANTFKFDDLTPVRDAIDYAALANNNSELVKLLKMYNSNYEMLGGESSGWASTWLGKLYEEGKGVKQDLEEAFHYYEKGRNWGSDKEFQEFKDFLSRHPEMESLIDNNAFNDDEW